MRAHGCDRALAVSTIGGAPGVGSAARPRTTARPVIEVRDPRTRDMDAGADHVTSMIV